MPTDDSLPPLPYSLAMLVNKLRGQKPANYSYAQTRLGRQPVIYSQDQSQFNQVDSPQDWGAAFSPTWEQKAKLRVDPTSGPLGDPVNALLGQGSPVSVIAPYQSSKSGLPGDVTGTPSGVPLHESVHQFIGSDKLPLDALKASIDPQTMEKMRDALERMNTPGDKFGDEIPARLASGQYSSLGLSPEEGQQLWHTYLDLYQKMNPAKANRLRVYTKNRSVPVDPELSTSSPQ